MKFKKLKKGFTLVELVVVIAVIAILGAVSVGAYFGIVGQANRSADEQAVAQMNKALKADEILNGKPEVIEDALQVLTDNGMSGKDYIPLTSSYDFLWFKEENSVLLGEKINAETVSSLHRINDASTSSYKILYPEEFKDTTMTSQQIDSFEEANKGADILGFEKGYGSEKNPYIITNEEEFINIGSSEVNQGSYFELGNDISVTGDLNYEALVKPIFSGTFNGANHTIEIREPSKNGGCTYLFGYLENATIKNLNIFMNNSWSTISEYASNANFENIKLSGNVEHFGTNMNNEGALVTYWTMRDSISEKTINILNVENSLTFNDYNGYASLLIGYTQVLFNSKLPSYNATLNIDNFKYAGSYFGTELGIAIGNINPMRPTINGDKNGTPIDSNVTPLNLKINANKVILENDIITTESKADSIANNLLYARKNSNANFEASITNSTDITSKHIKVVKDIFTLSKDTSDELTINDSSNTADSYKIVFSTYLTEIKNRGTYAVSFEFIVDASEALDLYDYKFVNPNEVAANKITWIKGYENKLGIAEIEPGKNVYVISNFVEGQSNYVYEVKNSSYFSVSALSYKNGKPVSYTTLKR